MIDHDTLRAKRCIDNAPFALLDHLRAQECVAWLQVLFAAKLILGVLQVLFDYPTWSVRGGGYVGREGHVGYVAHFTLSRHVNGGETRSSEMSSWARLTSCFPVWNMN